MANAADLSATYTERTADAILALINCKPRSPTRDELVAALSGLTASDHLLAGNDKWGRPVEASSGARGAHQ